MTKLLKLEPLFYEVFGLFFTLSVSLPSRLVRTGHSSYFPVSQWTGTTREKYCCAQCFFFHPACVTVLQSLSPISPLFLFSVCPSTLLPLYCDPVPHVIISTEMISSVFPVLSFTFFCNFFPVFSPAPSSPFLSHFPSLLDRYMCKNSQTTRQMIFFE